MDGCRHVLVSAGALIEADRQGCLRAVFGALGAPRDDAYARDACATALALRDAAKKLCGDGGEAGRESLRFGVSVASGEALAGVYGAGVGAQFGVLGEVSELGSRLCTANRIFGSRLLVSARTRQLAEDAIEVRPMAMVFDPARNSLAEVYELLAAKGGLSPEAAERRDRFWEGVVLARAGRWQAAKAKLDASMTGEETDFPLEHMLGLVRKGLATSGGRVPGLLPAQETGESPWPHAQRFERF
jgi:hypothetical protein